MTSKTIIICGNHHAPATELIRQLRADKKIKWLIYYISSPTSYPQHIKYHIKPLIKHNFIPLESPKISRHHIFTSLLDLHSLIPAIIKMVRLINKIKPNITVSFGGFTSVPIVIAGWLLHIPSVNHEQTQTLSLSTKVNSLFCKILATSFSPPPGLFSKILHSKTIVTGNLLRQEIYQTTPAISAKISLQTRHHPLLLIVGGGQGSQYINQLVPIITPHLSKFTIVHQTGPLDKSQTKIFKLLSNSYSNYHQVDFISSHHIGWALNTAKIIISRAGANFTQEYLSLQKSTILIPHPKTQQNEQYLNALFLQQQLPNQTIIISQSEATGDKIISAIAQLSLLSTQITPNIDKHHTNYQLYEIITNYSH